jgi:multidrug transporter EmrE-like cation transporter
MVFIPFLSNINFNNFPNKYKMSYQDLIPLVLTEIVGDFGYKVFANQGGLLPFATGTIGYVGVVYFLIRSLQGSNVLTINAAWDGISALLESIAAYIFLGERLEYHYEYIGIILIILGLLMLKIPLLRKRKFHFPKILGFISGPDK